MEFFEVKVKYDRTREDGTDGSVIENYAVDALLFTEAEARVTKEMQPYITGDFMIKAIKRAPYGELVSNGGDKYFLVMYNIITIDERSGKEKKSPMSVLFQEESIDDAKDSARSYMKSSVLDYELVCVKETKLLDVFLNQ